MDQKNLIGIDEAGRGALAGPLFVAGCKLFKPLEGLGDSKKLSQKQRLELYGQIVLNSSFLILSFSHLQIDELGLSECLRRALKLIKRHFKQGEFLFDGNADYGVNGISTLIKADAQIPQVSAASILAKVSRDEVMSLLSKDFKEYNFAKNKAYASKEHILAIQKHGYSQLHRKSFKLKCFEKGLFDE